eukprot:snap_masked-scaffold_6-processed-gene-4.40-mRNA-1 protein AED:0.08 eAED:1.00 QI:0/-1/0/1/-1/1/1/0/234
MDPDMLKKQLQQKATKKIIAKKMEEKPAVRRKSLRPSKTGSMTPSKHQQIKGKLRKKNSLYFKPGNYAPDRQLDLRAKAKEVMEKENTLRSKQPGQFKGIKKMLTVKKNSVVPGSLDFKLASFIDAAFSDLSALDETVLSEEKKEKQLREEREYNKMREDAEVEKMRKKYTDDAKKEFESFFSEAEKELTAIEQKFGIDDASILKLFEEQKKKEEAKTKKAVQLSGEKAVESKA